MKQSESFVHGHSPRVSTCEDDCATHTYLRTQLFRDLGVSIEESGGLIDANLEALRCSKSASVSSRFDLS